LANSASLAIINITSKKTYMTDWELVRQNAIKSRDSETEWASIVLGKRYRILQVDQSKLIIGKEGNGKNVLLNERLVNKAAQKLKIILKAKKSTLFENSVARETAFVHLHPNASWNLKLKEIRWTNHVSLIQGNIENYINEASDDELEKITVQINKRNNQSKFRDNLLKAYENKCCISNTEVLETLEAAHISLHSKTGVNSSENGLLLRADFHALFDSGLLIIHPTNLTVHIHPSLSNTEYFGYDQQKIASRKDKKLPSEEFLKVKWNSCKWKINLTI
jgi:hypothetical protein